MGKVVCSKLNEYATDAMSRFMLENLLRALKYIVGSSELVHESIVLLQLKWRPGILVPVVVSAANKFCCFVFRPSVLKFVFSAF